MHPLYFDGVVFGLQKAGGISATMIELLKRVPASYGAHLIAPKNAIHPFMAPENLKAFKLHQENLGPKHLRRYLRPNLQVASSSPGVFVSSYYRILKSPNIKNICLLYDFAYERFRKGPALWVHHWQKFRALNEADAIVCISEATRQDAYRFMPELRRKRVEVYGLGPAEEFKSSALLPQGDQYLDRNLIFVGARSHYKNFRLALEILKAKPEFNLKVVGPQDFDEQESEWINKQGLGNRITHLGRLDNQAIAELYRSSFALLYPSDFEGFGMPVVEAAYQCCPVIAKRTSSIPEVHGFHELLLDQNPLGEALEIIERLKSQEYRAKAVAKQWQHAQQFNFESYYDSIINLSEDLAAGR